MQHSIEIFICYAREDEELRKSLEKQLRALRREGLIDIWHDRQIIAGAEREGEINRHLDAAQIILLLISPDFMASDYCYGIEMERAMQRHQSGEADVIPVILRPTLWQGAPFSKLQALPTDAIPVVSRKWHSQDEAFFDIAKGIQQAAEKLKTNTQIGAHTANIQKNKTFQIDNPFIYGKPVQHPEHFFGRGDEVSSVLSRLRQNGSSSLIGERSVGRTSILNYINHPSVRQSQDLHPSKYIFVYLNVQTLDSDVTPVRLWQWLLQEMAQNCLDAEIKQVLENMSQARSVETLAITKFFERMNKKEQYPVFLLDEFELITKNKSFGPDFFYHLRNLATLGPLSLVTSSRRDLGDLCHSEAIRCSPFFNIFGTVNIRLLTKEEAQDLILHSLNGTDISFSSDDLDVILQMAGTHPYFLQVASSFLFEASVRNLSTDKYTFLRKKFDEQTISLLRSYWGTSNDQERIILLSLALLERQKKRHLLDKEELQVVYPHPDQVLTHLEDRSLLISEVERYGLFNTSFSKWIYNQFANSTAHDQQGYDKWFKFNKHRLSPSIMREMGELLPMLHSEYRELLISWVGHLRNLTPVAKLLKTALEEN